MQKTLQYRHSQDVGLHISNAAGEHHATRTSTEIYHEALHAMMQESITVPQNKPAPEKALPEINMTTDDLYSSFLEDFTLPDPHDDFLEEPLDKPTVHPVKNETFFEDELSEVISQVTSDHPSSSQVMIAKSAASSKGLSMPLIDKHSTLENSPNTVTTDFSIHPSPILTFENFDALVKIQTPTAIPEAQAQIGPLLISDTLGQLSPNLTHHTNSILSEPAHLQHLPDGPIQSDFLNAEFAKTHFSFSEHHSAIEEMSLSSDMELFPYLSENTQAHQETQTIDTTDSQYHIAIQIDANEISQLLAMHQSKSIYSENTSLNNKIEPLEYHDQHCLSTPNLSFLNHSPFHSLSNFTISQINVLNTYPVFEALTPSQNQIQESSLAFQINLDSDDSEMTPSTLAHEPSIQSPPAVFDDFMPSVIHSDFSIDLIQKAHLPFIELFFEKPQIDESPITKHPLESINFSHIFSTSQNIQHAKTNHIFNKVIDVIGLELDVDLPIKNFEPSESTTHYFASDKITHALFFEIAFLLNKTASQSYSDIHFPMHSLYSLTFDEPHLKSCEEISFFSSIYDQHELYFFSEEMSAAETLIC